METGKERANTPQAGTPAAPQDAAEARRQWQARMAAQQRTGGMTTAQMQALRRTPASPAPAPRPTAAVQPPVRQAPPSAAPSYRAPQQAPAPAQTAAPPPSAARPPVRRTATAVPPRAPASAQSRPVRISRAAVGNAQTARPAPPPAPRASAGAAPEPARTAVAVAEPARGKAARRNEKGKLPPALSALLRGVSAVLSAVFTVLLSATLLAIPLFMFWYDYTIDRNGWFQGEQFEREVAQALLDGKSVSGFSEIDERQIMKLCAQNMQSAPHSIALGSSRIMQLNRALTGDDSFFNVGMIGAEYPDVYIGYYLFDRVDKIPDTVIIGLDPWLFSAAPEANTFKRVDMQMWNEYRRYVLGQTDVEVEDAEENMNYWLALTSPAFFRETLDYYIDNKENGLHPSVVTGDELKQTSDVKRPDGSLLYHESFRNATVEESNHAAEYQYLNSLLNCEDFYSLDPEHIALFEQFIAYVRAKGSEVVLLLPPFHNNCYDWILNFPQRYSGFFQVENWVRQYAAQNGIPVYGSYDPVAAGCDESDFFDGWHVRDTGIAKFFPGLPAVEAARAAGTLPDPLAVSPRLPTATEDPVL